MIGTVLQNNDLFPGDIYSNIAAMKPGLSVEEAWDAAEKAGIADDIREMPMGMRTFVSEGRGTLSGGQKQRILIARVIAAKPKVLVFDEATSALDNVAQKKVSDALDAMRCTRIVIAHRISTVRHCDRIVSRPDAAKKRYPFPVRNCGPYGERLPVRKRLAAADQYHARTPAGRKQTGFDCACRHRLDRIH